MKKQQNTKSNHSRGWRSFLHWLFELIHFQHYQEKLNGSKRIKTIKITGFRSALVDDAGQRKKVVFYFRIGKFYF